MPTSFFRYFVLGLLWVAVTSTCGAAERVQSGLLVLYDFADTEGKFVQDISGHGKPLHLRIENAKAVRRTNGALEIRGATSVHSEEPATKIIQAVRQSGEITIEAWIRTSKTNQTGPARIVTLSRNANERNFTLGQDGGKFDVRLRTQKTSTNGIPSVSTPARTVDLQQKHVVYTRERSGRTRMFINGEQVADNNIVGGTNNWQESFRLGLGNEFSAERPWLGTYYLVAVYRRDLSPVEIKQNFAAGPRTQARAELAKHENQRLFETKVASIFARHCLECHDAGSKKGGLVLSRKADALTGGESGKAIVPGKASESLLWTSVQSDDMPKERPALSAEEKKTIQAWIHGGATWSLDTIDPAIYAHDATASDIWIQRLTRLEYIETVRVAVGVDIRQEASEFLPPDIRADGFSNTAYNLNVDLKHVEAYARLAEVIVDRMDVLRFASRFSKSRKLSTDATMRQFVADMGKWLLRGPLEDHEISAYSGIATTVASAGGGYEEAVSLILEAMLQSPRFIYRVENQRGDGSEWPVNDYELASRLSYIVWGGPPDAELMRAADEGQLDRAGVAAQVERMLKSPRAVKRSRQFIHEWLNLGRLDNLKPNRKRYPHWTDQLARDMREETLAYFEHVVWTEGRPLADLLNAQVTFATGRLATHYGLPAKGPQLEKYDLSKINSRGGLLTHGSVLTVGGDDASMVTRGLFVLHDLLRGTVKDPPPCVDTTPVPTKAGLTQRLIAESRIANAQCGGCHSKFEPLAFGLERFDGLGAYHEKDEHANPLREDGVILFPGSERTVKYQSAAELMDLLAESDRVQECITWKVTQFALGRPLVAADARILDTIHQTSLKNGGTYTSLITAIVTSDLVLMTRTENHP